MTEDKALLLVTHDEINVMGNCVAMSLLMMDKEELEIAMKVLEKLQRAHDRVCTCPKED